MQASPHTGWCSQGMTSISVLVTVHPSRTVHPWLYIPPAVQENCAAVTLVLKDLSLENLKSQVSAWKGWKLQKKDGRAGWGLVGRDVWNVNWRKVGLFFTVTSSGSWRRRLQVSGWERRRRFDLTWVHLSCSSIQLRMGERGTTKNWGGFLFGLVFCWVFFFG